MLVVQHSNVAREAVTASISGNGLIISGFGMQRKQEHAISAVAFS
jgi:acyl CoA:acetate/3-ketoacid CoA transferase alpha subunit